MFWLRKSLIYAGCRTSATATPATAPRDPTTSGRCRSTSLTGVTTRPSTRAWPVATSCHPVQTSTSSKKVLLLSTSSEITFGVQLLDYQGPSNLVHNEHFLLCQGPVQRPAGAQLQSSLRLQQGSSLALLRPVMAHLQQGVWQRPGGLDGRSAGQLSRCLLRHRAYGNSHWI